MTCCEQCQTHEATLIDDDAGLWCPACRDVAQARGHAWLLHEVPTVQAFLRGSWSAFGRRALQETYTHFPASRPVHVAWAQKLGEPWPPPVDRMAP